MALYSYKALNEEGKVVKGKISARNEQELEAKLKQSSLDLITAEELKSSGVSFFNKASLQDLILICVHLHQLEKAGVPILDSIGDLKEDSDSQTIKNVMMDVHDSLKSGKLLSVAMAEHSKIFDNVFISLVAAGEKTGSFAEIFGHLEHHLKWILDIKTKIKKATMYPIFLFFLLMGVIMIMMVYVIPKLTVFLLAQNIPLPFYTRALIATSDFVVNYWYVVFCGPIVFYGLIRFLCWASLAVAYQVDAIILKLPYVGLVIRKLEISRFCHFFALTYKSGMGILECLTIAGSVVQNQVLKESIEAAKTGVSEGQKITNALKATGQFPSLVVRMFKVGENSGNLDGSLQNVNHFYDQEVNEAVNGIVSFLQPALTLVMGAILGWITISVFGPVYASFGGIK